MLNAENVTIRVNRKLLVDNVSLSLSAGELMVITGPNGAGKSTLIKALSGEFPAAAAHVKLNDAPLTQWSPTDRARMCAVLPQSSSLSFPFSAWDVVLMGRSPHRHNKNPELDHQIVNDAMERMDILHLGNRNYTTLSGGEKQKVHFARVLAQIWLPLEKGNRVLILDEPTSALDIAFQHHCLETIAEMAHQQKIAVLAILHDLNMAAVYADKIAIMHCGKLVAYGNPSDVLTQKNITDFFSFSAHIVKHPQRQDCPLIIPIRADKFFSESI